MNAVDRRCPRCRVANLEIARFCARCGLSLDYGSGGDRDPGRVRHPRPAAVSDEYLRCTDAPDLFFRTESSLGGKTLLGTEGINVLVFNRGYSLCEATVEIKGAGDGGDELFATKHTLERLPRDRDVIVEIPSYELSAPLRRLTVRLISAEYDRTAEG